MEKTENKSDNRDKYLVAADRIRVELELLEKKFDELSNLALDEKEKADKNVPKIDEVKSGIRELERDITAKKGLKRNFLKDLKFFGLLFIPEVIAGYLIMLVINGVAPSIIILIIETILIDGAFLTAIELPKISRYRGVDVTQYEGIIAKLKDRLTVLEEEKQLHLDNTVTYSAERDDTDERITKLNNDLEYILNARNKIIEMVLKNAIDSSFVDTSSIDADIVEHGIEMELK